MRDSKQWFAVEIIGCGKRRRYCIKRVVRDGWSVGTYPTDGRSYGSAEAATAAAQAAGIEIAKIGDSYQII